MSQCDAEGAVPGEPDLYTHLCPAPENRRQPDGRRLFESGIRWTCPKCGGVAEVYEDGGWGWRQVEEFGPMPYT